MSDRGDAVDWFLSTQGRIARIVGGSLLIIIGLGIIGGFAGVLLLIIGAVPIASAAYGTFLLAPFFGRDIRGRRSGGAPTEEAPARDDEEPRDEAGDESRGTGRGDEAAEEPQEQLEKDTSGEATATRDEGSAQGRREGTGGEGRREGGGGEGRARADADAGAGDGNGGEPDGAASEKKEPRSQTGAPPLARAERPPGQEPRTKDIPLGDPPSGGSSD